MIRETSQRLAAAYFFPTPVGTTGDAHRETINRDSTFNRQYSYGGSSFGDTHR